MTDVMSVIVHAPLVRRLPAPKGAPSDFASVDTYLMRVRANELPAGIPDDANPREPNLNRRVYRRVRSSLMGEQGVGSFHLKHGGIVVIADRVEKIDEERYRLWFDPDKKQGIANGNHSYTLILDAQKDGIPEEQFVEVKVHTMVPVDAVADLADGLNTSMQVREESLADLRNQFDWLKAALGEHANGIDAVAWHEGNEGEYDVREVLAILMALDPSRYSLADPVGIENTYARVSSVFNSYLGAPEAVERFAPIALEAMELYEYIRRTALDVWNASGNGRFKKTRLADNAGTYTYPFTLDGAGHALQTDARLTKAAAMPCLAAFRAFVEVPSDGTAVRWRYEFDEIKAMWDQYGAELLREVYEAITRQHNGNTHYAGRSPMLYRATTRILELADLRRRVAD
ncbi:AIPR family protein [Curtobacterium sp. MCPF17_031]|uniref:AIPR family protein n=1 Tax=Curtobacterium sp. MCPF17_031 TaxID=2175653 RepID=UPI000DAAACC0|nr:AIPR family protein [Curtobacterium sp. MCPF17_031]PZE34993.1 hypothetical protein DEJ31_13030 [Curtobacterium sp. MCPF17_031]